MLRGAFRPWGQLTWLLRRLRPMTWSFLGSLAAEPRCLAAWEVLKSERRLKYARMFEIHDEHPSDTLPRSRARACMFIALYTARRVLSLP